MDETTKRKYDDRSKIIKALAHPTRLFIVDELAKSERCVCEIREMVGADMSTISKHLSLLKNAGIVSCDKRGLQVFYSLRVPCVASFFSCIENILKEQAVEQLQSL